LPAHPTVYSFILRPNFKGLPDDQIQPELTRILHIIDTQTDHIGGDGVWWVHQFEKYIEEHANKVSHNDP
jgi:hypothetical protein